MKLVPSYPCRDLDGTPWPSCDHQHSSPYSVELVVLKGLANTIIKAGIPPLPARAGDIVYTTWGCSRNLKLKTREAFICSVEVQLVRHPQSMFYRPQLRYIAWGLNKNGTPKTSCGMVLTGFSIAGKTWEEFPGGFLYPSFRLEWISPITQQLQRVSGSGVHFIR